MSSLMLQRIGGPDRTRASMLEDLDLRRTDKHGQVDLSLFASPVLRRLKLSGAGFDFHELHMLMCPALTHLTLSWTKTPITTGEIIGLLSSAPRLHSIKLEIDIIPDFALDTIVKVITLQELCQHPQFGICIPRHHLHR
ncbi:hypothetical protein NEOLEDRAFT_1136679 [Neolentinus lepideus HHB14362 ss-1]|uniref:F-box domain-containing protein n=1 Tax=Neolentinus lepideus HHB14362 ss-1 TaxID=1314782 RepID=A0A165R5B4_9AGAM|nr:hypothetical protein NEOLEDRAFT_1136679 [Neolentinus lepideus HHB14362 ss-1]